jgi:multidrug efflux system membrane fusion protein
VAEVVVKAVNQWDEFTGHIEAMETVEIQPQVAGYIEQFNFQEGQEVKKGEVLFVIDQRLAAESQAKADILAAEAAADIATLNLDYTEVRSPIDGRAGRALVRPGNLVSGGEMVPEATLLTTVVSLDPVYVYFEGDEQTYLRYAAMARKGERPSSREVANPVFIGLADEEGFPHEARMNFVDNQLDPATGTIRVRATTSRG